MSEPILWDSAWEYANNRAPMNCSHNYSHRSHAGSFESYEEALAKELHATHRPEPSKEHADRFAECQRAIEDRMLELLGDAQVAGWTKEEVLAAMIEVADNTALAMQQNVLLSVETELRKLMKKKDV
ncbi:hypothetical protein [Candidatus Phyllobacterium onerii]|nr:hypothetical protein [Phyllobacterium sp. IY22]